MQRLSATAGLIGLRHHGCNRVSLGYQSLKRGNRKFRSSHVNQSNRDRSASGWRLLRLPLALFHQFLDLPLDQVALEKAQMIEEKDTIEMVHFVAERPRQQILAFDGDFLAVQIDAFQIRLSSDAGQRGKAGNAQAAFIFELFAFRLGNFRIDDRDELISFFTSTRVRHHDSLPTPT